MNQQIPKLSPVERLDANLAGADQAQPTSCLPETAPAPAAAPAVTSVAVIETPESAASATAASSAPPAPAESAATAAPAATPAPAPPAGPLSQAREWSEMIKLEHTVFALPFALSGLLLAVDKLPTWATVGWTILAFAGARAAAMTLNRLIDANYDALNPRTSTRAIPAGRIGRLPAAVFAFLSFALMIFAAVHLPPICVWLSPVAILWLSFYSFTKRFTWMCHFALGIAIAGAALGGWIAAGGSLAEPAPWILALAVGTWVAGFDLIYACQDVDFDRGAALHSLPARFGILGGLCVSTALHIVTLAALTALGVILSLGVAYWVGVAVVGSMLLYEHTLVAPDDLSKVNAAFFTTNGFVSIGCFIAILIDRLVVALAR